MTDSTQDQPPPRGNQYEYWRERLESQIEHVRRELAAGGRASALANSLREHHGLGCMHLILVFREATGAALADLKGLSSWWDPATGVTDPAAFDAWADQVLK